VNLAYLLERANQYSDRGDVLGWFSLAREYLEASRNQRLDDFLKGSLGVDAPPPTPRARLDHLGLTFVGAKGAFPPLDEAARAAGLDTVARFPSVLLANTLARHEATRDADIEVVKAWSQTPRGKLKVEVLLVTATRRPLLQDLLGPPVHVAFAAESVQVHDQHGRHLEALGLKRPEGGAAWNPHEGLFSSYFDGVHAGAPLRLELCYAPPTSVAHA